MSLQSLPTPLLLHILSFVPDLRTLSSIARTCRDLHSQSSEPILWDRLYNLRWTISSASIEFAILPTFKLTEDEEATTRHFKDKLEYIRRFKVDLAVTGFIKEMTNDTRKAKDCFTGVCSFGKDALDICYKLSQDHKVESMRACARSVVHLLRTSSALEEFTELRCLSVTGRINDEGEELEAYSIAMSMLFYDNNVPPNETTASWVRQRLDGIAAQIKQKFPEVTSNFRLEHRLDCIHRIFFDELCFRGNDEEYYDYQNSLVHASLLRKMGIPLTLAILYKCICRRLDIKINIIGLPGHVIAQVPDLNRFINVFDHGNELTLRDIERIVNGFSFIMRPEFLQPLTPLEVATRIVNNISNCNRLLPISNGLVLKRRLCLGVLRTFLGDARVTPPSQSELVNFWAICHIQAN